MCTTGINGGGEGLETGDGPADLLQIAFYASDDDVRNLTRVDASPVKARYLYMLEEMMAKGDEIALSYLDNIIDKLRIRLELNCNLRFVIAAKAKSLFQVRRLDRNKYIVIVDHDAIHHLKRISFHLLFARPVCEHLGAQGISASDTSSILEVNFKGELLTSIVSIFALKGVDAALADKRFPFYILAGALLFIIAHEVAHVAHGHIDFMYSDEYTQFATTEFDESITRQTLEMDADSSAATSVLGVFQLMHAARVEQLDDKAIAPELKLAFYRHAIVGIYAALLYTDARTKDFRPRYYPTSYHRFLIIQNVLHVGLDFEPLETRQIIEDARKWLADTFEELSGGLQFLEHPMAANAVDLPENRWYYSLDYKRFVESENKRLLARWALIRPVLMKFHQGGKLAPAQVPPQ